MTDNPLNKLQEMVNKDPELVFAKTKGLFGLSEDSLGNIGRFIELTKNGYVPVIYGNHQSHADSIILSALIEQTIKNMPAESLQGFLCPVAASMESGDQNDTVAGGVDILLPIFEKKGFIMIPVIREDDRKKYGMTGSNLGAIGKLLHAPRDKFGLAIFPEGTVQGGRTKEDGTIYGMRQVKEGGRLLLRCINFWKEQGKKSVLLPIGIINSYRIFSPESYHISEDTLAMINGTKELEKVASTEIGKPFTIEDIQQELSSLPNPENQDHIDYLMKKIASLLPEDAKGYYGDNHQEGL